MRAACLRAHHRRRTQRCSRSYCWRTWLCAVCQNLLSQPLRPRSTFSASPTVAGRDRNPSSSAYVPSQWSCLGFIGLGAQQFHIGFDLPEVDHLLVSAAERPAQLPPGALARTRGPHLQWFGLASAVLTQHPNAVHTHVSIVPDVGFVTWR